VFSTKEVLKAHLEPLDSVQNLSQLLTRASTTTGGLVFHSVENEELKSARVSYSELLEDAGEKARMIGRIEGLSPASILLLHFDTQRETIQWFWAATLAGYLPAISTPFVNDTAQRKKHLLHLHTLLKQPVVLTRKRLIPEFLRVDELTLHDVESLQPAPAEDALAKFAGPEKTAQDVAILMLTSGSTGSAKAVPLRHRQIVKAVQGKSAHHGTVPGDVFLNWVGLDHVASVTEIHLHASMILQCNTLCLMGSVNADFYYLSEPWQRSATYSCIGAHS
jgi:acyl-CoA synthetase (AMP-forming)/AMP-acid ligase II